MDCQGCAREAKHKLVMRIYDNVCPKVRNHIVHFCTRCLNNERKIAKYVMSTPPGFCVVVTYPNGAWQVRKYTYTQKQEGA